MGGMKPIFPNRFKYRVLDVRDTPTERIAMYFDSVVQWISNAVDGGGNVLVHW